MAGKLKVDQIEHSTAGSLDTSYVVNGSAKSWVNFNGTGVIAARDSLNVSGLLDNGNGDYSVNFGNAFSAADYASTGNSWSTGSTGFLLYGNASANPTTSASRFTTSSTTAFGDSPIIGLSFNGELA